MALTLKSVWQLLKSTVSAWSNDKAPRLGAALAYYTVFSIPPLLIIVLFVASLVFDPQEVQKQLISEVGGLVGDKSAEAIQSAMTAQYQSNKGIVASSLAIFTLVLTATGLFIELQDALNTIWGVRAKAGQSILGFIKNRLLSFAMIVGIGFLLLVSLVISAGIAALSKYVGGLIPGLAAVWMGATFLLSFAVITVLFAMIFKVLPDVRLAWRDVWLGAAVTSALFTIGKFALGAYLGRSTAVSAYGAAGSLVLILLWVYYSAQILFFGAELTKVYACRHGKKPAPRKNAEWFPPDEEEPAGKGKTAEIRDARLRSGTLERRDELQVELKELKEEIDHLRELVER